MGSAHIGDGRLGNTERVVGITTVFSGDGNYCVSTLSRAVSFDTYGEELLNSLKSTIGRLARSMNWQPQEVVEVLLKLLTEPDQNIKVFAGILTSSSTGKYGHVEAAKKCFHEAVEFVKRIIGLSSLASANIYAYLATIPDSGPVRIHWGPVEEAAVLPSEPVVDQLAGHRGDDLT